MLKNLSDLTQQAINKANEVTQASTNLTGNLTESTITMVIDKTIDTLHIAAKRVKEKQLSTRTVTIGACVNIAMIQINIEMEVSTENDGVITQTSVNEIHLLADSNNNSNQ